MSQQAPPSASESVTDRRQAIAALEAHLAGTPRGARPYEHAAAAYRLGLAYAESPVGDPAESLRKALACYEVAAAIFDARLHPVEHARVLNAAGAAHRALGGLPRAASLFEAAGHLLSGRGRDGERAAALNNLGLVRTELGEPDRAVAAFDEAVALFDPGSAEGRRGRAAALHNRGHARAATGTRVGLEAALADYAAAEGALDPDDGPYHDALVHHSIGVAYTALGVLDDGDPAERGRYLDQAVAAFDRALTVFSRSAFPYQHALGKHNLGRARAMLGGVTNQRRALACFEDAVAVLDPRLHADVWRQAYASLAQAEQALEAVTPGMTRPEHFAAFVADCDADDRVSVLRERLVRLLSLPEPRRHAALGELALAAATLDSADARHLMEAELQALMEFPNNALESALRARLDAHRQLSGTAAGEAADRALDEAISGALGGPQRVFVRDFLYSLGWERP